MQNIFSSDFRKIELLAVLWLTIRYWYILIAHYSNLQYRTYASSDILWIVNLVSNCTKAPYFWKILMFYCE